MPIHDSIQQGKGILARMLVTLFNNFMQGLSSQMSRRDLTGPCSAWNELICSTYWAIERSRTETLRSAVQWLFIIRYRFLIILTTDAAILVAADYPGWPWISKVALDGLSLLGREEQLKGWLWTRQPFSMCYTARVFPPLSSKSFPPSLQK